MDIFFATTICSRIFFFCPWLHVMPLWTQMVNKKYRLFFYCNMVTFFNQEQRLLFKCSWEFSKMTRVTPLHRCLIFCLLQVLPESSAATCGFGHEPQTNSERSGDLESHERLNKYVNIKFLKKKKKYRGYHLFRHFYLDLKIY